MEGARVQIVGGPRSGETVAQSTPCNYWGYGGPSVDGGFMFVDLAPGVAVTLRGSAPRHQDREVVHTPYASYSAIFIELPRR